MQKERDILKDISFFFSREMIYYTIISLIKFQEVSYERSI